jgi:hypothetical protein
MKFKMAATAGLSLTLDPMEHFPLVSNVNLCIAVAAEVVVEEAVEGEEGKSSKGKKYVF